MSRILQIAQLGNPVLREIAKLVDDIDTREVQELIDDMFLTVAESKGVGLAAPQVYVSRRIFIISSRPNTRYPTAAEMPPTVMINPEMVSTSDEVEDGWEGCLSIPGIRAIVPRYRCIGVRYTNRNGQILEAELEGFLARVFQHELDHLDGKVIFDRVTNPRGIVMEQEWLKMMTSEQKY